MKKSLVLAAGLLAASLGNPAHAANDWKTYSGLVCQPVGATTAADLTYNGYGVTNKTLSGKQLICPLVQDHDSGWSVTDVATIHVGHSTGAVPGSVSCTFYYGTKDSGFITKAVSSPVLPANSYQAGPVAVIMDAEPATFTAPGFPIFALCSLSSRATINAFWMNEAGVTNTP